MQIPPLYTPNLQILEVIAKIEAKRFYLSSLNIPVSIKEKIKRTSLLKSSLFSARIEGNPLQLTDLNKSRTEEEKKEKYLILKKRYALLTAAL